MKKKVFMFLACLILSNVICAQRTLKTESDGFQWYWEIASDGKRNRAIGLDGRELVPFNYMVSYNADDGVFYVLRTEEDLAKYSFGYYSRKGRVICVPGQYDYSTIVNTDRKYVKIKKNGLEGALSLEGNVIIPPLYDECMLYSLKQKNGYIQYFGVKKNGKEGAFDISGKMIVPIKYNKLRYKDWGTNDNGFEGMIGNSTNYESLNQTLPLVYTTEKIKELFTNASKETDATKKIKLYSEIITYDSYNMAGVNSYAYNNLGVAYENLGDLKKAQACYEKAYNLDSSNKTAYDNLQNVKKNIRNDAFDRTLSFFGYISSLLTSGNQANMDVQQEGSTYSNANVGGGHSSNTSRNKVTSKSNHANWRSLEQSYSNYESQLIRMSNSSNIDKQEVRSIQRKMRDIREKIRVQSGGHQRATSQWENWNP